MRALCVVLLALAVFAGGAPAPRRRTHRQADLQTLSPDGHMPAVEEVVLCSDLIVYGKDSRHARLQSQSSLQDGSKVTEVDKDGKLLE